MKHVGSTILLLIFIGLLVVALPYFQYPTHVSAFQIKPIIQKTAHIKPTHVTFPTVTPRFSIQTVRVHNQIVATPIPTVISQPTISVTPNTLSLDSIQTALLTQVNDYRKSQGLDVVNPNKLVCDFAMLRAQEIATNFSHQGFDDRVSSKTLPYTSYSLIVENIAMNSDEGQVVTSWISSSGHAANMRAGTPNGCIGHSGAYYVYEGWRQ